MGGDTTSRLRYSGRGGCAPAVPMDEQEQVAEFKPNALSVGVLIAFAVAVALALTALLDTLLTSDTWPKVFVMVIVGLLPLGQALGLRNSYVVKIAPTWMSGPGRESKQVTVLRNDVVALRRRDDTRIVEVKDAEPIVIQLRYYGNAAWRLDSAIHDFASGVRPWIVRKTA